MVQVLCFYLLPNLQELQGLGKLQEEDLNLSFLVGFYVAGWEFVALEEV